VRREELVLQPRDGRLFDIWTWSQLVGSSLGPLPVELHVGMDGEPTEPMLARAEGLAAYASRHGEAILDVIFGHYRRAEEKNWLAFWGVPAGLTRSQVLGYARALALVVVEDLTATVFADPRWDPEHKLDITVAGDGITEVDGEPFRLEDGILRSS